MSNKNDKKQYLIGSFLAGAASAACLLGMKLIDRKIQKKKGDCHAETGASRLEPSQRRRDY